MKKLAIALLATLAVVPLAAKAHSDFWNIAGGIVVGGIVLDEIRERRRESDREVYYVDPPMRKVMICERHFEYDHRGRKRYYRACYEDWVSAQ